MSTTSGRNVLRYSALCVGVFYGFYHQRSITTAQKTAAVKREYDHKQQLINQAKEAYAKSKGIATPAATAPSAPSGGLNQDPMDPKFDLEAYLTALESKA